MTQSTIGFFTLLNREVERFLRVWTQTFLPPVISALLYVVVFGRFIGDRIGQVGGLTYMEFLVPGLIIMNVITSSYGGAAFTVFFAKWEKTIHDILTSPLSYLQMVGAILIGGGVIRAFIIGVAVTVVMLFVGTVILVHPLISLFFLLLIGLLFSSFGMVVGLWADRFDHFNVIQTFLITPLIYFGGVFYSIDTLPQTLQTISQFNPLFYMIDGFRYGMTGFSDAPLWMDLTVVGTLTVVMLTLCVLLFRSGYKMRV